jgi:hypothetical protein
VTVGFDDHVPGFNVKISFHLRHNSNYLINSKKSQEGRRVKDGRQRTEDWGRSVTMVSGSFRYIAKHCSIPKVL